MPLKMEHMIALVIAIPIIGVIIYYLLVKAGVVPPPAEAAPPTAAPAEVILQDDFEDGVIDPAKWETITVNGWGGFTQP